MLKDITNGESMCQLKDLGTNLGNKGLLRITNTSWVRRRMS